MSYPKDAADSAAPRPVLAPPKRSEACSPVRSAQPAAHRPAKPRAAHPPHQKTSEHWAHPAAFPPLTAHADHPAQPAALKPPPEKPLPPASTFAWMRLHCPAAPTHPYRSSIPFSAQKHLPDPTVTRSDTTFSRASSTLRSLPRYHPPSREARPTSSQQAASPHAPTNFLYGRALIALGLSLLPLQRDLHPAPAFRRPNRCGTHRAMSYHLGT